MRQLRHYMDNGQRETDALRFGRAYHTAILEPELLNDLVRVLPAYNRHPDNQTQAGKRSTSWSTSYAASKREAFELEAKEAGAEIVSKFEFSKLENMRAGFHKCDHADRMFRESHREVSFYGKGSVNGRLFDLKCRMDLVNIPAAQIGDIKGCGNASPVAFGRDSANYNYAFKQAFYAKCFANAFGQMPTCTLIALEKEAPHDCACYEIPEQLLDQEWSKVRSVLEAYGEAVAGGEWPGCVETVAPLYVPNWLMSDEADNVEY